MRERKSRIQERMGHKKDVFLADKPPVQPAFISLLRFQWDNMTIPLSHSNSSKMLTQSLSRTILQAQRRFQLLSG